MKKFAFGAATVYLGILCAIPLDAAAPTTQQAAALIEHGLEAQRVDVTISGFVVDEQGQAIKGARILVMKGWLGALGTTTKYANESIATDGPFQITAHGVTSLSLSCWAEGYFATDMRFSASDSLPKDWEQRLARGEAIPRGVVKRDKLKVVLEKHGPLVALSEKIATLSISGSGKAQVLDLDRYDGTKVEVTNIRDAARLPSRCVYMLVEADDKGSLQMTKDRVGGFFPTSKVQLVMNDEGGFIAVPSVGDEVQQYRSMKEAPEKGYAKTLTLEAEELKSHLERRSTSSGGQYFYLKTSKGYGKGRFWLQSTDSPTVAQMVINLRFQPDGSRLVATSR
jgi:hypothetical protein